MTSSTSVSSSSVNDTKRSWRSRSAWLAFLFFFVKGLVWLVSLIGAWMLAR
jgi:DMSO reductase anchor subunit